MNFSSDVISFLRQNSSIFIDSYILILNTVFNMLYVPYGNILMLLDNWLCNDGGSIFSFMCWIESRVLILTRGANSKRHYTVVSLWPSFRKLGRYNIQVRFLFYHLRDVYVLWK